MMLLMGRINYVKKKTDQGICCVLVIDSCFLFNMQRTNIIHVGKIMNM